MRSSYVTQASLYVDNYLFGKLASHEASGKDEHVEEPRPSYQLESESPMPSHNHFSRDESEIKGRSEKNYLAIPVVVLSGIKTPFAHFFSALEHLFEAVYNLGKSIQEKSDEAKKHYRAEAYETFRVFVVLDLKELFSTPATLVSMVLMIVELVKDRELIQTYNQQINTKADLWASWTQKRISSYDLGNLSSQLTHISPEREVAYERYEPAATANGEFEQHHTAE